jgi:hypothetical protein
MTEQQDNPRLFIVGAPKCATSTLHDWLGQHPGVFASAVKETHFFTHADVRKTYYVPAQIVSSEEDYAEIFAGAHQGQWILDSTPNYLLYPYVAGKIKERYPEAKVIAVLRDPAERAISHFKMDRALGIHSEPLDKLLALARKDTRYEREYLGNSRYASALAPYVKHFGENQLLVLDFDRFRTEPDALLSGILRFLNLPATPVSEIDFSAKNQYSHAGNYYHRILRKLPILYPVLRAVPNGMKERLKKVAARRSGFADHDDDENIMELKNEIRQVLAEDVLQLIASFPWTVKFLHNS